MLLTQFYSTQPSIDQIFRFLTSIILVCPAISIAFITEISENSDNKTSTVDYKQKLTAVSYFIQFGPTKTSNSDPDLQFSTEQYASNKGLRLRKASLHTTTVCQIAEIW